MPVIKDITGQKFGKITVIRQAKRRAQSGDVRWHGICDCGNKTVSVGFYLRTGRTLSCGCSGNWDTKHNMSGTREHELWMRMRQRCNNQNNPNYSDYGGRGISVCDRWEDFENFFADMGKRPGAEFSIDRIDNDGDYEPGNCRWATQREQCNNKRDNRILTYKGKSRTMSQWARHIGLSPHTLKRRIYRGWSVEDALTKPLMKNQFG